MGWRRPDLTAGVRPALRDGEEFVVAQPEVALYDGEDARKPAIQGWAYLTTQRVCVVSATLREGAAAAELCDIADLSYVPSRLNNSAKIALLIVDSDRQLTPAIVHGATWVCPICSFPNELGRQYVHGTSEMPVCEMCGVRADEDVIRNAVAIREGKMAPDHGSPDNAPRIEHKGQGSQRQLGVCPRCTFANHPDMDRCEMCGTPLKTLPVTAEPTLFGSLVRLSFRSGGSHIFMDRLNTAVNVARSRNSEQSTPTPTPSGVSSVSTTAIRTGLRSLLNNDQLNGPVTSIQGPISSLMAQLGLPMVSFPVTRTMAPFLGPIELCRRVSGAETEQLARQLLEFVVDGGALDRAGGTLALSDLFAEFNRRRGMALVTPEELGKALEQWSPAKLDAPEVEVRPLGDSALRVVVHRRRLATRQRIADWLARLEPWQAAIGVSARQASERFGWSFAVAMEELLLAERAGELCRDDHPSGLRFFPNLLIRT